MVAWIHHGQHPERGQAQSVDDAAETDQPGNRFATLACTVIVAALPDQSMMLSAPCSAVSPA